MTADDIKAPAHTIEIDTDWFVSRLATVGQSMNSLGRHLNLAGSQVSRMMNGKRKMQLDEAPKIARFLNVPVEDVLKHAGLKVDERMTRAAEATEIIDGDGRVRPAAEPIPLLGDLSKKVRNLVPIDQIANTTTALIVAPKGALSIMDDQVVVYEKFSGKPPEMGTLSMARLIDGVQVMGRVKSASKTGDVTLKMWDGEERKVKIEAIAKVIGVLQ